MDNIEVSEITTSRLQELVSSLWMQEGVVIDLEDIHYSIMNREEWIYVNSDLVYPTEDIPDQFGVYVGYAGGDMHSSPVVTELDRMSERRKDKAKRLLELFRSTYVAITKDINALTSVEV